MEKNTDTETNEISYEIKVPLNSSLLTFKSNGLNEEEVQKLAATLPVAKLAALLQ